MNRRLFLNLSSLFTFLPLARASEHQSKSCYTKLTGLHGVDVESNIAEGFSHFHQLIIPVADLISPPEGGIKLLTSCMDQGSFDQAGLEQFASEAGFSLEALQMHDHDVFISRAELRRIASGESDVEITVYARDKKTYVHSFFVTAPPSALAAVREAAGTRKAICKGPIK
ncbi:MAG: hypothetical protein KDD22_07550 [Bdellovibrionales bacterium]|nr:hypothetical protein [Bdellovibrionales bacterium]